jgi:hypothetical protein
VVVVVVVDEASVVVAGAVVAGAAIAVVSVAIAVESIVAGAVVSTVPVSVVVVASVVAGLDSHEARATAQNRADTFRRLFIVVVSLKNLSENPVHPENGRR